MYTITQMVSMGYSRLMLTRDVHAKSQTFAVRTSAAGKFLINKEKYDRWLQKRK